MHYHRLANTGTTDARPVIARTPKPPKRIEVELVQPPDIELAWAAGLFEGEGTVRINKVTGQNLGNLCVSVVSTDRQIAEFFHDRWRGYMKTTPLASPRHSRALVWVIASRKAAAFLKQIRPFLVTGRMKERVDHGLSFQEQKSSKHSRCRTEEYHMEQFHAYLWMRELNSRGSIAHVETNRVRV
jgi:hypothetical protein